MRIKIHQRYFHNRLRCIAQSTAEYAVLLAILATALIGMQLYLKRGIQGRLRDLAITLAPGTSPSGAAQYEGEKVSNYATVNEGLIIEDSDSVYANIYEEEYTTRVGDESVVIETQ